jgi:hypothetical protein
MNVLKIGFDKPPFYIASNLEEAQNLISEAFLDGPDFEAEMPGTKLTLEVVQMSKEELEKLPDFEGF